jgi:hypothetical protein
LILNASREGNPLQMMTGTASGMSSSRVWMALARLWIVPSSGLILSSSFVVRISSFDPEALDPSTSLGVEPEHGRRLDG